MSVEFPKTVGACIDTMYELRAKRLGLQKEVDQMAELEKAYEEHILNQFTKAEINGARGDIATAGIKQTTIFNIVDWELFTKYVATSNSWDLMRKQAAATACRERFDNAEEVPGVEPFIKIGLSLTKAAK